MRRARARDVYNNNIYFLSAARRRVHTCTVYRGRTKKRFFTTSGDNFRILLHYYII